MSGKQAFDFSSTIRTSKCAKCDKYFRKMTIIPSKLKIVSSRAEAQEFTRIYEFHVQSGDIICQSCYSGLRAAKSRKVKQQITNESYVNDVINTQESITADSIPITSAHFSGSSSINVKISNSNAQEPVIDLIENNNMPSISCPKNDKESSFTRKSLEKKTISTNPSSSLETGCQNTQSSESTSEFQETTSSSLYSPQIKSPAPTVIINFNRVIANKGCCFICYSKSNIREVPLEARIQVFQKKLLFIPNRNRSCRKHMIGKLFFEDELQGMRVFTSKCKIAVSEVEKFLEKLSDDVDQRVIDKIGSMRMSDERVKSLTGLVWANILELREMLTTMRDSENRNKIQALIIFLFKMRTGNSDLTIATIMELSAKVVNDSVHSVLECFENYVLPKNFGINVYSREFLLGQRAPLGDLIHPNSQNKLQLICDGTYLRHQKSSNNAFQRKSYSGQKKTPLCKPFTICTTNGFTVDAPGPFNGTMNDAQIMREVLKDPKRLGTILKPGDEFILDRGFRDVVPYLQEKGYNVLMPSLKEKKSQLSAKESNQSRFVTALRWVVETIHGIIGQKFRLLHNQFYNNMLKDARKYCGIAYFLINKFGKRLNVAPERIHAIAERMNSRNFDNNELAEEIERKNWNRKTVPFQNITSADLLDFPRLTMEDLILLFTGTYQLGQAVSYLGEMLDENGHLDLKFVKDEPEIIRFEVRSRHINAKTYKSYVKYDVKKSGIDAIVGYCCNCANGLRTIGCCSHVASLLYHLSHGRYLSRVFRPAEILSNIFDVNGCSPVIDEDSDED